MSTLPRFPVEAGPLPSALGGWTSRNPEDMATPCWVPSRKERATFDKPAVIESHSGLPRSLGVEQRPLIVARIRDILQPLRTARWNDIGRHKSGQWRFLRAILPAWMAVRSAFRVRPVFRSSSPSSIVEVLKETKPKKCPVQRCRRGTATDQNTALGTGQVDRENYTQSRRRVGGSGGVEMGLGW